MNNYYNFFLENTAYTVAAQECKRIHTYLLLFIHGIISEELIPLSLQDICQKMKIESESIETSK